MFLSRAITTVFDRTALSGIRPPYPRADEAAPPGRVREERDPLCRLRRDLRPDRAPGQPVQGRADEVEPDPGGSPEDPCQRRGLRRPDGPGRGRGLTDLK